LQIQNTSQNKWKVLRRPNLYRPLRFSLEECIVSCSWQTRACRHYPYSTFWLLLLHSSALGPVYCRSCPLLTSTHLQVLHGPLIILPFSLLLPSNISYMFPALAAGAVSFENTQGKLEETHHKYTYKGVHFYVLYVFSAISPAPLQSLILNCSPCAITTHTMEQVCHSSFFRAQGATF
jgi:hypothetical protein